MKHPAVHIRLCCEEIDGKLVDRHSVKTQDVNKTYRTLPVWSCGRRSALSRCLENSLTWSRGEDQEKARRCRRGRKKKEMLSLRKLGLLWITTLNHILYHDAWVKCQRIRESVWRRDRWREGEAASNAAGSRAQIDRRVHVWFTSLSTCGHAALKPRQQVHVMFLLKTLHIWRCLVTYLLCMKKCGLENTHCQDVLLCRLRKTLSNVFEQPV